MSSSEKFCLRWNDFESNISVAFRELREDKDFFDVTLACDDNQLSAHKVILSACSPFFRNILRRNPHQHPLLYLRGVRHSDLQSVLNFMYHGEVNVAQEELNSFLAVAEDLKVKGLTQNDSNSSAPKRARSPAPPPRRPSPRPIDRDPVPAAPKRPRPAPNNSYGSQEDDDIQEVMPVKQEPRETAPPPSAVQPTSSYSAPSVSSAPQHTVSHTAPQQQTMEDQSGAMAQYEGEGYEDYGAYEDETGYDGAVMDPNMSGAEANKGGYSQTFDELDSMIAQQMERIIDSNGTRLWQCLVCPKSHVSRQEITRHIESSHIDFPGIACHLCGKVCKTRNALRNHIYSVHNEKYKF